MAKKPKPVKEIVAKKLQSEFDLTGNQSRKIVSMVASQTSIKSGPFPSPEDYEQYQEIDPELTNLMKQMALKEQEHQHAMDIRAMDKDYKIISRGQKLAFAVYTLVILLGAYSIYSGFEWGGALITAIGVGGIVSEFLKRR